MKQIPNILTSLRIVLAGVFAWQFFVQLGISQDPSNSIGVHAFWIPIAIYAVAFLTDILDGFLARTFHWITPVGKILDPVADKLMAVTALVCILLGKRGRAGQDVIVEFVGPEVQFRRRGEIGVRRQGGFGGLGQEILAGGKAEGRQKKGQGYDNLFHNR